MAQINDFKSTLKGGGARANHFRAMLSMPGWVGGGAGLLAAQESQFLCHAAQLPASTLGTIPVQYRGRDVHIAGERTYEPWTVSIYNDTNFNIRNRFEEWVEGIQNAASTTGIVNPLSYQVQMRVEQLDRNGDTKKQYTFINAFPTSIGSIELSYEAGTAIESFDVTFLYDYWTSDTTKPGNGFGVNVSIDTPFGNFGL
jgi:hypothetical protein